jgi:CheY-like chemotaxis protein
VLVVEDHPVNRLLAVRLLERFGCSVDVAADGAEAVELTAVYDYSAIFMDCQMPTMDGYEATERIRRREAGGEHVPIIAMTANTMEGDRERCLAAGMDDYLPKPLHAEALAEALGRALDGEHALTPLLDSARLEDVLSMDGIAQLFVDETRPRIEGLGKAIAAGESDAAKRLAHTIKGSSASVGATRMAELAAELENQAAGDRGQLLRLHDELRQAFAATETELSARVTR